MIVRHRTMLQQFQDRRALLTAGLVVAIASRACYLLTSYLLALDGVRRYHVETAFVWFVLVGTLAVALRSPSRAFALPQGDLSRTGLESPSAAAHPAELLVFWALAAVLYLPAFSVGFLSDDYSMLTRAHGWRLGAVSLDVFRPLPLAIWAILDSVHASPAVFHAINVLLHGTNAYLAGIVVEGWIPIRTVRRVASLIVLSAPLSTEAVVWCSGLFDVLLTMFALMTVLIVRRYERHPSRKLLLLSVATGLCAMLCKETGVGVPVLLACDALARRSRLSAKSWPTWALLAIAIVYASSRVLLALGSAPPTSFNQYLVQTVLFQTFGSLAVPWRGDTLQAVPWLALAQVAVVVGIFVLFFVRGGRRSLIVPLAASAWVLCSIVPVAPILWIPPDLQSSRYLYLASVGWAGLLCAVGASGASGLSKTGIRAVAAAAALFVAISVFNTRANLPPWREAAAERDRVMRAATGDARLRTCASVSIAMLPDHVRGAYVFRNGAAEAFSRELHMTLGATVPARCAFSWNEELGIFTPPVAR